MLKFEAKKGDFAKIWQKLGGGGATAPQPPRLHRLHRPCFKLMYLQEFYRIWLVEVLQYKSMNKYLESKKFKTIEENAILLIVCQTVVPF